MVKIKMCGNCGEQHKYVDCPFTEDRIRKEEYDKLREDAEKYNDLMKANSEIVQHNINTTKDHEDAKEFKYWKKQIRDDCNLVEGQEFSRLMGIHNESQLWLKTGEKHRQIVKELGNYIKLIESLQDKDTLYHGHIERLKLLPELKKIQEGKQW